MTGRRSGRSGTARNQASSPPKESDRGTPESSSRRRTTRSQSVNLDESVVTTKARRAKKQSSRQGSVESVGSNKSASFNRNGRTTRAKRGAVQATDLSMVAEGDSEEEAEVGEAEVREAEVGEPEVEEADPIEENPEQDMVLSPHSPSALSQMSGTTAITTITTRSEAAIADLDDFLEEDLPDIYSHAMRIVDMLAPSNVSDDTVLQLFNRLKIVGSKEAIKLQRSEQVFEILYERFLTKDDLTKGDSTKGKLYIRTDDIIRKFLGKEHGDGNFRPDAILHLANLASMIRNFVATDQKSQRMRNQLFLLNRWFPEAFARDFNDTPSYGNSTLLNETFELALEIRTQLAISELRHGIDSETWDPDLIITEIFFANDEEPKSIMGIKVQNAPDQMSSIIERVEDIRSAFRDQEQAQLQGDLVDFEQLDERYPWPMFLMDLVSWAKLRKDEIVTSVKEQGGPAGIKEALSEVMTGSSSQDNTTATALPDHVVQLSTTMDVTGELPSKDHADRATISYMRSLHKPRPRKGNAPLNKTAGLEAASRNAPANIRDPGPSVQRNVPESADQDQNFEGMDDEDSELLSIEEATKERVETAKHYWMATQKEKNKENIPTNEETRRVQKRPFNSKTVQGEKVSWDTQQSESASTQAREQSQQSEDTAFQDDNRTINQSRRIGVRRNGPTEVRSPPRKKRRQEGSVQPHQRYRAVEDEVESEDDPQPPNGQQRQRKESPQMVNDDEEDSEEDAPPPTAKEVREAARIRVAQNRPYTSQTRIPWSENDQEELKRLIEHYGCKWSVLALKANFERDHGIDEVALKDKARNMKVAYLKGGIQLPLNFDQVKLGKKEVESVRKAYPDYDPNE